MENPNFNDIQKEISALRKNLENANSNQQALDKIGIGLDKLEILLDPRPPVSLNNFCPNCGHDLNSSHTSKDLLDM